MELTCLYSWLYLPLCSSPCIQYDYFDIFQVYKKRCHPKVQVENIHRSSHDPFGGVLWSVLHWNDPEFSMKSKHGQQRQRATVWTRGDRAAEPSSQLGAQINRQDRHSVCVYSSPWLCLLGTQALFEQVRIVDDCMKSVINEDMLRGQGNSIMTFTHFNHEPHSKLIAHIRPVWATSASEYINLHIQFPTLLPKNDPADSEKRAFNVRKCQCCCVS